MIQWESGWPGWSQTISWGRLREMKWLELLARFRWYFWFKNRHNAFYFFIQALCLIYTGTTPNFDRHYALFSDSICMSSQALCLIMIALKVLFCLFFNEFWSEGMLPPLTRRIRMEYCSQYDSESFCDNRWSRIGGYIRYIFVKKSLIKL